MIFVSYIALESEVTTANNHGKTFQSKVATSTAEMSIMCNQDIYLLISWCNVFFILCSPCRDQRYGLVQTLDEYIFIHEVLLERIMFESFSDIRISNLQDYIAKQKEITEEGKRFPGNIFIFNSFSI